MINLPESTLALLAEKITLANNGSFLWRKLSESPTIQYLVGNETSENLVETLKEVLAKEQLTETDYTLAYAALVAILQKNPMCVNWISTWDGIGRLHLAKSLFAYVGRFNGASQLHLHQKPVTAPSSSLTSASTDLLIV